MKFAKVWVGAPIAVLIVLAAAAPVHGASKSRPRPVQVQTTSDGVRATLGSYCVRTATPHGSGSGICADSAYPLKVKGKLPVRAGLRVALRMHDPKIRRVSLRPLRVHAGEISSAGARVKARPRSGHPNRWIASLPSDLGRANRLDLLVRYRHGIGDADYWAGLRVVRY